MNTPLSIRRIVAATDFSDGARTAFKTATDLAARSGAALDLVHAEADDGRRRFASDIKSTEGALRVWAREAVGSERLEAIPFEVVAVRNVEPKDAFLRHLDKTRPDLLVAGTHGRRGVRRFVMGSFAERLVRFSPCPVLTVPYKPPALQPGPQAPVLAAVDFSAPTDDVLRWAKHLAALYAAPLDVLHVVLEAIPVPHFYPAPQRPPLRPLTETTDELKRRAREEMERALAAAAGPEVETRYHVCTGTPTLDIPRVAREHGAALIVMGTQGLTGVERLLLGSTAEATVRTAPCAVLTTRLREVTDPDSGAPVSRAALAEA